MNNIEELSTIINKLKNILNSVKDDTTRVCLSDFIENMEHELEQQESNFAAYFGNN